MTVSSNPSLPNYGLDLERQLLGAFRGKIEPIKTPTLYKISLILVSLTMALLPLIYFSLVALLGYGVFYYATHFFVWFPGRSGIYLRVFLYAVPLIVGTVATLFLIKPLFAKPYQAEDDLIVTRKSQPLLFSFVRRITEAVGAPFPAVIAINNQVNASASLRHGLGSLFSNKLTLHLGFPLLAGMSLNQVAGIMAHEFGHFSQKAGMRLSFVIRSINYWFLRVVYERDVWDHRLDTWQRESDFAIVSVGLFISKGMIWLSRRLLRVLMYLGERVSFLLMRQMEFDADRHEVRLVGAKVFTASAYDLAYLHWAAEEAFADQGLFFEQGKLCDDFAGLVAFHRSQLTADSRKQLNLEVEKGNTRWDDTHPCDRDRITSVRNENANPVFSFDAPARILLRDFKKLCQTATKADYSKTLGDELKENTLRPLTEMKAHAVATSANERSLDTYFGPFFHSRTLIVPQSPKTVPGNATEARAAFEALEKERNEIALELGKNLRILERLDERASVQSQAAHLLAGGVEVDTRVFMVAQSDPETVARERERTSKKQDQVLKWIKSVEPIIGKRLGLALVMAKLRGMDQRLDDHAKSILKRREDLLRIHKALTIIQDAVGTLSNDSDLLRVCLDNLVDPEFQTLLITQIDKIRRNVYATMVSILEQLRGLPLHLEHTNTHLDLAAYLLKQLPMREDSWAVLDSALDLIDNCDLVHRRVLANLTYLAEAVEAMFLRKQSPA